MSAAVLAVQPTIPQIATPSSTPLPELLRHRLRQATADIHAVLHHAAPFARIARGEMDHASYALLLRVLEAFHRAMLAGCRHGWMALGLDELATSHVRRIMLLEADLDYFGLAPLPHAAARGDAARVATASDAFAIGCLYTVQGSTLGGKVIHRQIETLLPTEAGRRFFRGTDSDGTIWQAFCQRLEAWRMGEDDIAEMIAGARHAFAQFQSCLLQSRPLQYCLGEPDPERP